MFDPSVAMVKRLYMRGKDTRWSVNATGMKAPPFSRRNQLCERSGLRKHCGRGCAADLKGVSDGTFVRIAGAVITRQRPGTASGFIFISNEDETGISNAIIHPKVYEQYRMAVTRGKFLLLEGTLQNQDGVISVKTSAARVLEVC